MFTENYPGRGLGKAGSRPAHTLRWSSRVERSYFPKFTRGFLDEFSIAEYSSALGGDFHSNACCVRSDGRPGSPNSCPRHSRYRRPLDNWSAIKSTAGLRTTRTAPSSGWCLGQYVSPPSAAHHSRQCRHRPQQVTQFGLSFHNTSRVSLVAWTFIHF